MTRALPAIFVFVLAAGGIGRASDTGPPPVTTTGETLAHVLGEAARARGKLPPNVRATVEEWSFKHNDVAGTEREVRSGDDYRVDRTYGKLHSSSGRYHGQAWHQGYSGYTVLESGVHRRDAVNAQALKQGDSGVTLLGESAVPAAYVVRVAPPGGRVEYLFYDKSTYLLVRSERIVEGRRAVANYGDFQTTAGVTRAYNYVVSDGRDYNEWRWTLAGFSALESADDGQFAIPPDARNPVAVGGASNDLPARIIGDRIIVTAEIGGRRVNLQLDSGASGILLDRSVGEALRLPIFGKSTQTTAGSYVAGNTIISRMTLGSVTVSDIEAEVAPFVIWADEKTPVAGLLGFDFIAGCVVKIDYETGTVAALDPKGFVPPAGAVELPIALDDDVPIFSARIGQATANHFILDTGADRSMLFSEFVAAHPNDTVDQGLGNAMTAAFPFSPHLWGVGGKVRFHPVQVPSMGFASYDLPNWLFYVSEREAQSFEGEDFDGLLGQDVLRNFTVYLDYHHQRVYLMPNERFHRRWG